MNLNKEAIDNTFDEMYEDIENYLIEPAGKEVLEEWRNRFKTFAEE